MEGDDVRLLIIIFYISCNQFPPELEGTLVRQISKYMYINQHFVAKLIIGFDLLLDDNCVVNQKGDGGNYYEKMFVLNTIYCHDARHFRLFTEI